MSLSRPACPPAAPRVQSSALAACLLALAIAGPARAQAPDAPKHAPLATVNGQAITPADLKRAEAEMGPELARMPEAQRRQRIIQILVETEVMATAAEADKLGQGTDFEARVQSYRRRALRDAFFDKKIRDGVGEAEIKAFYDKQAEASKANPQVRARHILVEKEEEAKALRARIAKGEDFAKLAAETSKDTGSGKQGGDLGYMQRGQTVAPFEAQLFQLKPGEISDPVKTEFGWHLIKVEEHRAFPPLAELRDRIVMHLIQEKAQAVTQELRAKARIEYLDPDLKQAMAPPLLKAVPLEALRQSAMPPRK